MSVAVVLDGVTYTIPSPGDSDDWGAALNAYLIALGTAAGAQSPSALVYGVPFFENATRYMSPGGPSASAPTAAEDSIPMPVAGTVGSLQVKLVNAPMSSAVGAIITFTVRKNGVDTGMVMTLTAAGEGGTFAYKRTTTGSFTVAVGDLVSVKVLDANLGSALGHVVATLKFTPS